MLLFMFWSEWGCAGRSIEAENANCGFGDEIGAVYVNLDAWERHGDVEMTNKGTCGIPKPSRVSMCRSRVIRGVLTV